MKVFITVIAGLLFVAGISAAGMMEKKEQMMDMDHGMTAKAVLAGE